MFGLTLGMIWVGWGSRDVYHHRSRHRKPLPLALHFHLPLTFRDPVPLSSDAFGGGMADQEKGMRNVDVLCDLVFVAYAYLAGFHRRSEGTTLPRMPAKNVTG